MRSLLWSVGYLSVCGVLAHVIGEALPRRWFSPRRSPFAPWRWEQNGNVYRKLFIHKWKDHLPDMSRICKDMVPKRFDVFPTPEAVERLLAETCVAEAVHWGLCLLSAFIPLFWKTHWGFWVALSAILGNLPFIMIQRYNRPQLTALHRRLTLREERKRNAHSDPDR